MKTLRVHPDKEPQFTKRKRLNITRKIDKGTDLFIYFSIETFPPDLFSTK